MLEPASTTKRFSTVCGNIFSLYSSLCCSKISIQGILTTRMSKPFSINSFLASTAKLTSEPLAIIMASGFAFIDSAII